MVSKSRQLIEASARSIPSGDGPARSAQPRTRLGRRLMAKLTLVWNLCSARVLGWPVLGSLSPAKPQSCPVTSHFRTLCRGFPLFTSDRLSILLPATSLAFLFSVDSFFYTRRLHTRKFGCLGQQGSNNFSPCEEPGPAPSASRVPANVNREPSPFVTLSTHQLRRVSACPLPTNFKAQPPLDPAVLVPSRCDTLDHSVDIGRETPARPPFVFESRQFSLRGATRP
jgi:hypothetical protein